MTKVKIPKLHNPIEKHFNLISRYHYIVFFLIFCSKLPVSWHTLNLIFLSPPIDFKCAGPDSTNSSASSTNTCPCKEPSWDKSVFIETMQTKFGLYCDSDWLISFTHSINYLGLLLGAVTFGFLSDRYGRLSIFSLCCFTLGTTGSLVSVMPNIASFAFMRCLEGVGTGGAIVTAYVLCIEYCGVRHREIITALFHIPVNLSHVTLPGVSYLLRHCDEFQLTVSTPVFIFVSMKWLIMESPKWLMDSGNLDKAVKAMETIATFNGETCENIKEEMEAYQKAQAKASKKRIKFWKIFKYKKLTLNLIYMSIIYFMCGLGYYGVSQYIGKMSGNVHVNVSISGVLLLPGTIASTFLLQTCNRRPFLMTTNFLSGLFMIIVVCIPSHVNWARVVFACVCNCFFFMSFIIVFLYGVELFPTSIRNSALGILSVMSRLGQIVAPPINALPETASGSIFGVIAIIGTVLCYLLPETKNTELPSSLEESKILSRKKTVLEEDLSMNPNLEFFEKTRE